MKNVYILTENGKTYNEEGCAFIETMIKNNFNDTSKLVFSMGDVYNNAGHLKSELEKHPDSYIAVAEHTNAGDPLVTLLVGDNVKSTIELLAEQPGKKSWISITKKLKEMRAS